MQDQQVQQLQHSPGPLTEGSCDVAAFVFDANSSESFAAAQQLLLKCAELAQDSLPCVLIAAKDELGISTVSYICDPKGGRGWGVGGSDQGGHVGGRGDVVWTEVLCHARSC